VTATAPLDVPTTLRLDVDGDVWECLWGRTDEWGSPAFWVEQTRRGNYEDRVDDAKADADLLSETVFCLLGGYGVTAEHARLAHQVLMAQRWVSPPSAAQVTSVLSRPLPDGRRYRFPRQRGQRIAAAWSAVPHAPEDPTELHEWLLDLNGVGPKTAAWIVRNFHGSDTVAIVDIWMVRALELCGVFRDSWRVDRDYASYQSAFHQYAQAGGVRPSALDMCIWEQARLTPDLLVSIS
jgi:N-glycosylase/DNA lyase